MTDDTQPIIKIGGVEPKPVAERERRLAILLWSLAGVGKTTLACTAPGRKLLIQFDPEGDASVVERDDVDVVDLSSANPIISSEFTSSVAPLGITEKKLKSYDTVIVDSLTNAMYLSLLAGVEATRSATLEVPGYKGWGFRTARTIALVKNMLRVTGKVNKHIIFTAHEGAPHKNEEGVVLYITLSASGQVASDNPKDLSEIWAMEDTGKVRRIAVRPCRLRKPMKTRMFITNEQPEFVWKHTGTELADWYEQWKANGWKKIPLPKQ